MERKKQAHHIDKPEHIQVEVTRLTARNILMIDEALAVVGAYGQVNLVVENGRLRFVVTQQSHDILKFEVGDLHKQY